MIIRLFITNNMIIKTGLPCKINSMITGIFGNADFKSPNNGCHIFGLGTKCVLGWWGY